MPDTSYARLGVARDLFELKLTYDVTSLVRMVPHLDADGNGQLTETELSTAVPEIADFMRRSIALEIDEQPAEFGTLQPVAWPNDTTAPKFGASQHSFIQAPAADNSLWLAPNRKAGGNWGQRERAVQGSSWGEFRR